MECSDHRSVCLSARICQLVAIFALVRSFVRSLYAFSLSHLWRRRRSRPSVPRCFFRCILLRAEAAKTPPRHSRSRFCFCCFESLFLLSLSLLRLRLQLWAGRVGRGERQTKPATAINNRRHAAASLCTICLFLFVVVLFCFWSPAACS